ncbi:hypothetical protein Tco_1135569 [Tanacetum coccineum]
MKAILDTRRKAKVQPKENKTRPNENCAAITRYLLACEAAWRIYGFDIHYRFPHVETLPFHLPNEQSIIFDESDSLDYTLDKALVNETKSNFIHDDIYLFAIRRVCDKESSFPKPRHSCLFQSALQQQAVNLEGKTYMQIRAMEMVKGFRTQRADKQVFVGGLDPNVNDEHLKCCDKEALRMLQGTQFDG